MHYWADGVSQDVRIGANARVENSILWDGAVVGEGARLTHTIVGAGYNVAADANLDDSVVANEEPLPVA